MGRIEQPSSALSDQAIQARIVIGVTGYRVLDNQPVLTDAIQSAIYSIRQMVPPLQSTPLLLCILSPLAEGADRLVAREVLHVPRTVLEAVLPIEKDDYVQDVRVWDLETGECLVTCHVGNWAISMSKITHAAVFAYGTEMGEVIVVVLHNLPMEPPVVTPILTWLFGENGYDGRWDNNITATCQWCGQRFSVADEILDVIRGIHRDASLTPDQSPYLELPVEAWEEPCLLSKCPLCHKPLKFNPFIVDNRGRY